MGMLYEYQHMMESMAMDISNSDNVIDSREVIKRIEELENDVEAGIAEDDEKDELKALKELAEEGEGSPDWTYGEILIRDSYFEDYARELASDIVEGFHKNENNWPYNCIDWKKAARELQYDYSRVDYAGVTYWIRS